MSVSLKQSYDIEYDGTANVARMDLFVDTADDLTGLTTFDSITLLQGSTAEDISTGDKYMMQTNGTWVKQPSQSAFANVYTKAEIDSMLYLYYTKAEADALFEWITVTITNDTLPITFIADGSPLTAWNMLGNGQQTGTPTPYNPITPDFVGTLDGADWTIPIICAEHTETVNLGAVQTVRKIRKLVLTGTETISGEIDYNRFFFSIMDMRGEGVRLTKLYCTHYQNISDGRPLGSVPDNSIYTGGGADIQKVFIKTTDYTTVANFKSYLVAQYDAGTPVVLWYVLAEPTTGIVNEPLAKIGDYADELHSEDAAVTIPTVKGSNTFTVDTTLQPSEITITGKIREVT